MLQVILPPDNESELLGQFSEFESRLSDFRKRKSDNSGDISAEIELYEEELELYPTIQTFLTKVKKAFAYATKVAYAEHDIIQRLVREKYDKEWPAKKYPPREQALDAYVASHPAVLGASDRIQSAMASDVVHVAMRSNDEYAEFIRQRLPQRHAVLAEQRRVDAARAERAAEQRRLDAEQAEQQAALQRQGEAENESIFTLAARRLGMKK